MTSVGGVPTQSGRERGDSTSPVESAAASGLLLPRGVAQVRPDAPAAVLMVELAARQVVYANPTAVQMAPGLSLPVGTEDWSSAADLRDLDGSPLDETDHPLSRVARFQPVAGQGVSAARATDLGPHREPLWVVALPLDDAPNLVGYALVVFLPVRDREQLQARVAAAVKESEVGSGVIDEIDQVAVREAAVLATGLSFTVADARTDDLPLVWVNPAFTAVTGYSFESAVGRNCRFLQGPGTDPAITAVMRRALTSGEPITVTLLNYRADGTAFWNQVAMSPILDPEGAVTHFVGIQTDVSGRVAADFERDRALEAERSARSDAEQARRRAEEAQADAEAAQDRLHLLAEVTRQLSETRDAERALDILTRLVVPVLGDWVILSLYEDATHLQPPATSSDASTRRQEENRLVRGLRDVAWWHHDPVMRPVVERLARYRLSSLNAAGRETLGKLLGAAWSPPERTAGKSVPGSDPGATTAEQFSTSFRQGRAYSAAVELAPSFTESFAMRSRGLTIGLLTLGGGPGRSPLRDSDRQLAADLATRAGIALDAARLYRQQRDIAVGLQRSLLTLGPAVRHDRFQVAVRYLAAAEAAQVGGDFYDVFTQPAGATVVVIGDVMGHDTQAAAAMAQLRSIVRALGVVGDDGPAAVLRRADEVMAALGVTTTATVIAARLHFPASADGSSGVGGDASGREQPVLTWSSAGHPAAMLVHPDGRVEPLTADGADLLLGVRPMTQRQETSTVLAEGATVVLYTDGLVETRSRPLAVGIEDLRSVLTELAPRQLDPEALADEVVRRLVPEDPADDVALVAVRISTS